MPDSMSIASAFITRELGLPQPRCARSSRQCVLYAFDVSHYVKFLTPHRRMNDGPRLVAYQRRCDEVDREGQAGTCICRNTGWEEHLRLLT